MASRRAQSEVKVTKQFKEWVKYRATERRSRKSPGQTEYYFRQSEQVYEESIKGRIRVHTTQAHSSSSSLQFLHSFALSHSLPARPFIEEGNKIKLQ